MKNINIIFIVILCCLVNRVVSQTEKIHITIENNVKGAPITLGLPFPKGALYCIDNIRLLDTQGKEIPCQTTEVATWAPADDSIKWAWIFFFSEKNNEYNIEYGKQVTSIAPKERIISTNNMRSYGGINVNTGPLSLTISKMGNGFLDKVYLDSNRDGMFAADELIASASDSEDRRGTFLDLLDDEGIDASKAIIHEVFREKGSGPMHAIFRIEGTYVYKRADNNISPFTIRLHTYAGKSYVRILHTLTYTGIPDKHKPQEGEHANIATQNEKILSENTSDDPGWMQPNDRISACGLQLKYHLKDNEAVAMPIDGGNWSDQESRSTIAKINPDADEVISLLQTGPERNRKDQQSTPTSRIDKFKATIFNGEKIIREAQKTKGWINITDNEKGISIGIKNFLQEYPKGLEINPKENIVLGHIWPSANGPMSFARNHVKKDGQMLGNFAQGISKTTEFIYYFHKNESVEKVDRVMDYVVNAPVAHANPIWYTNTKVYGNMAPYSESHPEFENALQYKYEWWRFNQNWQPWFGMFDYGDGKSYYVNNTWFEWTNNEPAVDFMLWTNFMRTGDPKYHKIAQAMSRHTMDVDNVHWPKKRSYVGQINDAIDFWDYKDEPESTPYLGIGRRHGTEHWYALLSAHVWVQGWLAAYYLTGDHRALEVAKMTGDTYIKRIWGDHDLRGRRLYLSVLNLVELYDATKLRKYKKELDHRVNIMLALQEEQGGNLVLDRYGYSQTYVAQGLYKYHLITGDKATKKALISHARWVRDVPPLNHEMESYLATIYPLLLGYEFSGHQSFFKEALARASVLKVAALSKQSHEFEHQKAYNNALLNISKLPKSSRRFTNWEVNQGLRVFGWTHAYNIPYLLYWLENTRKK